MSDSPWVERSRQEQRALRSVKQKVERITIKNFDFFPRKVCIRENTTGKPTSTLIIPPSATDKFAGSGLEGCQR
jgi:hypothetical protein